MSNDSRASLRRWIERDVAGDGTCTARAPAATTWLDVVRAAIIVVSATDRAWIRSWSLRWIREDGSLAIPGEHTGNEMMGAAFGRRKH